MHIRHARIAHRTARAGTVLAMAAGMVAVVATPSFAAPTATLSQTKGPAAGTNKITVTGATFTSGAAVEFTTAACPTGYTAAATGIVPASNVVVNTVSPTSLTVTVPTLSSSTNYNVCTYPNITVGSAQTSGTTGAPYLATGTLTSTTLSANTASAGATITITDTNTAFGNNSTAVEFSTVSCPATYAATSSTVIAGTVASASNASTATVTVPTGLSQTVLYYVCAYTGSTAGTSALISGTGSAIFGVTPLVLSPNIGPAAGTNTVVATDLAATFTSSTVVEFIQSGGCPATYATPSGTVVAATPTGNTATTLTIVVPALAAHTYFVCAYNGSLSTSNLVSGMPTAGYQTIAADTLTLNPTRGTTAAGTAVAATAATMPFTATTPVEFNTLACPATYAATSATVIAATATSATATPTVLDITTPALAQGAYSVCAYTGTTVGTSALMAGSSTGAYYAANVLTLSTNSGPTTGGNSITATTSGGTFISGQTAVTFVGHGLTTPCPTTYGTPDGSTIIAVTTLHVLSATKLAMTVPAAVTIANGPDFNVCAYAGSATSSALVSGTTGTSASVYTVAAQPTITSVTPAAGSTQGGTLITVTGTNLGGITSATVGGVPLLSVTSLGPTAFTAVTPPHSAGGPYSIGAVTAGGPATMPGAFTFSNGIVVTPNKASNGSSVDLDIQGIGFNSLPFNPGGTNTNGATPDDATAHVYLVNGAYDPTTTNATYKANGELLECVNVLVISDTELVCTMYLAGDQPTHPARNAGGTIGTASMVAGSTIVTDSGTGFAANDLGLTVTGTNIPLGATVVAVHSAHEIVISKASTAAVSGGVTLTPPGTVAAITTTAGSVSLTTTTASAFASTDVGRTISGPGIQPGTTIATVPSATSITLSLPASASATGTANVGNPAVPVGTYTVTIVSDGTPGASGSTFFQSVVSGGSTFTVAGF